MYRSLLITGGTGSFGKTFIPMTLKKYNPKRIVIFSRDEMKQWEMSKAYENDKRIRFGVYSRRVYSSLLVTSQSSIKETLKV